jgi:dihydroneopterin aldolase
MSAETVKIRLLVEGIEFVGHHGVYSEEQGSGTRFRVDVAFTGDLAAAADSDNINDAINYEHVVQLVGKINRQRRFNLIESFAGALADGMLSCFPRVEVVFVRLRKLSPRNLRDVSCAAVEVTKRRA